jgi:Cyclic nucleotide-binding domain
MRYESTVTSLSWIPSEAVTGSMKAAFDGGIAHYDQPPPGEIGHQAPDGDVLALQAADRFRFANVLSAWIETGEDGRITAAGYADDSRSLMGSTTVRVGAARRTFQAIALPDLRREQEHGDGWVRFTQTTGGKTGVPAPRRVAHPPFVQWQAPTVWTTLTLTLHASGQVEIGVPGASRFPRHWVYDGDGKLARKSGLTDFTEWYRKSFGQHTPWGDEDSSAMVVAVESALERSLSVDLMHGAGKPRITSFPAGATLLRQGAPGTEVYLVLDGVVRVERGGEPLADYGPGAMFGERAHLEGGVRTASIVAVTPCKVACVDGAMLERSALTELSGMHRREEA